MGMYIILFCLIILVFGKFRIRFKAVVAGIAAFLFAIVSIVLPNYYYPRANIVPGGGQAAFAMPIELLGRSAHAYPQDVTDSERKPLNHIWYILGIRLARNTIRILPILLRDTSYAKGLLRRISSRHG